MDISLSSNLKAITIIKICIGIAFIIISIQSTPRGDVVYLTTFAFPLGADIRFLIEYINMEIKGNFTKKGISNLIKERITWVIYYLLMMCMIYFHLFSFFSRKSIVLIVMFVLFSLEILKFLLLKNLDIPK